MNVPLNPSERNILTALRDLGGAATPSQIVIATGIPYPTVRAGLRVLLAGGLVRRVSHGMYELTERGEEVMR